MSSSNSPRGIAGASGYRPGQALKVLKKLAKRGKMAVFDFFEVIYYGNLEVGPNIDVFIHNIH